MTGHGYGRELANAQYTRTFSDLDGHPRTLVCGFRSRSLRGWGFESLRPHKQTGRREDGTMLLCPEAGHRL